MKNESIRKYPIDIKVISNKLSVIFNKTKFVNKDLGYFSHWFYKLLEDDKPTKIYFDLSNLEWVAHEELVYLSSLFHQFYKNKNRYELQVCLKKASPSERHKITLNYLWNEWKIYSFIPIDKRQEELSKYFIVGNEFLNKAKQEDIEISNKEENQYFHQITPFIALEVPKTTNDTDLITKEIKKIYTLDDKIKSLLDEHNSSSPFNNKSLSSIITKELYENVIDHAYQKGQKDVQHPHCYMSVSLRNKINNENNTYDKINKINKSNFESEAIAESKEFFFNKTHIPLNQNLLQFTLIDFGYGIPYSLHGKSKEVAKDLTDKQQYEILKNAFNYDSSRFELEDRYKKRIPRGLFDVISIVKRYNGLLIARSNNGRVMFDFSKEKEITQSAKWFEKNKEHYFNGTIITIFIPENYSEISELPIRPLGYLDKLGKKEIRYLSILKLQSDVFIEVSENVDKSDYYNKIFDKILKFFNGNNLKNTCVCFDFLGAYIDSNIAKKIIYFLTQDYQISQSQNAIIINFPDEEILKDIQRTILEIPRDEKSTFIPHPIPCLFTKSSNPDQELNNIIWVGIFKEEVEEYKKLNSVLNDTPTNPQNKVIVPELNNPEVVKKTGLMQSDDYGNIDTVIGDVDTIKEKARHYYEKIKSVQIQELLKLCTLEEKDEKLYLCPSNYYQKTYISVLDLLYKKDISRFISHVIYAEADNLFRDIRYIVSITLSSQLLAQTLINNNQYLTEREKKGHLESIRFSNYHTYHLENNFFDKLNSDDRILLICDVNATGKLIDRFIKHLENKEKKHTLKGIISMFDIRENCDGGDIEPIYPEKDNIPLICLKKQPVNRFSRIINNNIEGKDIIRINPATNMPITFKHEKSEFGDTVVFEPLDFLNNIEQPEKYIQIGHHKHNRLYHPYFFRTHDLFDINQSQNGIKLLKQMLDFIEDKTKNSDAPIRIEDINYVFYPIFSGAENFNKDKYVTDSFRNNNINFVPLARFNTPHGWRFTFPPKFLNSTTYNKNIFLIDDGSCTGGTILQMIDQISFLDVKSITLLSVVGRIDDYLREFLSRTKSIKTKLLNESFSFNKGKNKEERINNIIPLNIFFGTQWHLPTYPIDGNYPLAAKMKKLDFIANSEIAPTILKEYSDRVRKNIELKDIDKIEVPNYFPKTKEDKIPLREIILMRDRIGKIDGYRFYREYFIDFGQYVSNYYNHANSNSDLEIILCVILHEPYLIRAVQDFIPDVAEILLEYTEVKLKDISSCSYKWSKYSFLLVYFAIRAKQTDVVTEKSLEKITKYIDNDTKCLSVLFSYIMDYVPLADDELYKQSTGIKYQNSLANYINRNYKSVKPEVITELKLFSSYLNTFTFLDNELTTKISCVKKLNQFFIEEDKPDTHESSEKSLGIINTHCKVILSRKISPEEIEKRIAIIEDKWEKVKLQIDKLNRYLIRIPEYISIFKNLDLYNKFNSSNNIFYHAYLISVLIENKNVKNNVEYIYDTIQKQFLKHIFRDKEALLLQLFSKLESNNIIITWNDILSENKGLKVITEPIDDNVIEEINNLSINLPELYLKELFREIRHNFRYANEENKIVIAWNLTDRVELNIKNHIGNGRSGGKNGITSFANLKKIFTDFDYSFIDDVNSKIFNQTFTFKFNKNGNKI